MKTIDLTPEKKPFQVQTRRLRCLNSCRSTLYNPLPCIMLDGL